MLDGARSQFVREIDSGRLRLSYGSLTALPLDDASLDAAITINTTSQFGLATVTASLPS